MPPCSQLLTLPGDTTMCHLQPAAVGAALTHWLVPIPQWFWVSMDQERGFGSHLQLVQVD